MQQRVKVESDHDASKTTKCKVSQLVSVRTKHPKKAGALPPSQVPRVTWIAFVFFLPFSVVNISSDTRNLVD
ncbi:hypothetical protein NEUTE2DRAFT_131195 [Neurospora tetrasperma FGSC 2509]|nr:hypothetical protein NEUTE2DRAFT_131195 [Neurospora tetrasperma FGSC 2509]